MQAGSSIEGLYLPLIAARSSQEPYARLLRRCPPVPTVSDTWWGPKVTSPWGSQQMNYDAYSRAYSIAGFPEIRSPFWEPLQYGSVLGTPVYGSLPKELRPTRGYLEHGGQVGCVLLGGTGVGPYTAKSESEAAHFDSATAPAHPYIGYASPI